MSAPANRMIANRLLPDLVDTLTTDRLAAVVLALALVGGSACTPAPVENSQRNLVADVVDSGAPREPLDVVAARQELGRYVSWAETARVAKVRRTLTISEFNAREFGSLGGDFAQPLQGRRFDAILFVAPGRATGGDAWVFVEPGKGDVPSVMIGM